MGCFKVALESRQVGMIDCRSGLGGTPEELAQLEKLNGSIFELIETDAVFAAQIDPVYVVFKFPGDGRTPDGWDACVLSITEEYRGVQVMPGCHYLYQMTSNGNAGREEARHFGERLHKVFQGTTFSVLVTQAQASCY